MILSLPEIFAGIFLRLCAGLLVVVLYIISKNAVLNSCTIKTELSCVILLIATV